MKYVPRSPSLAIILPLILAVSPAIASDYREPYYQPPLPPPAYVSRSPSLAPPPLQQQQVVVQQLPYAPPPQIVVIEQPRPRIRHGIGYVNGCEPFNLPCLARGGSRAYRDQEDDE